MLICANSIRTNRNLHEKDLNYLIVINCFQFCVVLEQFCFNLKWDLHYNDLKCIKHVLQIILEHGYYR